MTTQVETPPAPKTVVHPFVDVLENEAEFMLVADLPGVSKDDLNITAEGNSLALEAQTETLEYRRSFAIGDDVDLDAIAAKLEHGVLEIHLPKHAQARVRKIAVQG